MEIQGSVLTATLPLLLWESGFWGVLMPSDMEANGCEGTFTVLMSASTNLVKCSL